MHSRTEAIDYSYPFFADRVNLLLGFKLEDDPWTIIRPFEWEVWVGIAIVIPLYWLVHGLADMAYAGACNWKFLGGFTIRTIFKQHCSVFPSAKKYNKILSGVWLLVCIALTAAFSGYQQYSFGIVIEEVSRFQCVLNCR